MLLSYAIKLEETTIYASETHQRSLTKRPCD